MAMASSHRARIIGTRHMVAAGHYLAAQSALQILEAGGNAVDAAVSGGIALGILQSEYVGFGGVAPMMIHMADRNETVTISGLGHWPRAASLDVFTNEYGGVMPKGLLRTVVPAAPDAWITALERYGTMSYGDVAAAALRYAAEGFAAPSLMCAIIDKAQADYRLWDANAAIYLPGGKPPAPGDLFVQSDLAGVIAHMIDEEKAAAGRGRAAGLSAARNAFYRGDIARTMVDYHIANDGWLRSEDLAGFSVDVEKARVLEVGGTELCYCGAWCQGPLLAETLAMLDGVDLTTLGGHNAPGYIHYLTEVLKLGYADRHHYFGDPKFVDVPLDTLTSADYARSRRGAIDPARAFDGMPPPGRIPGFQPASVQKGGEDDFAGQLDTSYIAVVDRHGNAVSATPSDGSAAAPVIPGLGFVPSSRGSQSWTDPKLPSVMGPGRRPRLTPSPAIIRRQGEWIMPIGSPGNDVQPQAMLQVFLNMTLWGMTPQTAIDQPRFATFSYPRSSSPHSYDPGMMNLEADIGDETADALRGLGHDVRIWPEWEYQAGGVCTVRADMQTGMMEGGSDPRRPTGVATI